MNFRKSELEGTSILASLKILASNSFQVFFPASKSLYSVMFENSLRSYMNV